MKTGLTSLILLLLSFYELSGQFKTYVPNDTLFRYGVELEEPLERIREINISDHLFPCVDKLVVSESNLPRTDFELVSESSYKEFYSQKSGILNAIGFNGNDPFFNQPNNFIQYFNDVPVARANRKDDFSSSTATQFFISYSLDEMPQDLKDWAYGQDVTAIKVLAELEWSVSYNKQDEFKFLDVIYGFTTKNKQVVKVVEMELEKEKWTKVTWQGIDVLRESFAEKTVEFDSFYPFQTNVEMARLYKTAPYKFYFQLDEEIGYYTTCRHQFNEIYVYPNPTFGDIKIKFKRATGSTYKFQLFNIVGRPVWSTNLYLDSTEQLVDIVLDGVEKGIYFYSVSDHKGNAILTKRLTVIEP